MACRSGSTRFERFLNVYQDWRGKVTYLQITPKSRSEIREICGA